MIVKHDTTQSSKTAFESASNHKSTIEQSRFDKSERQNYNRNIAKKRGREAIEKLQAEKDKEELDNEIRKIRLAEGINIQKHAMKNPLPKPYQPFKEEREKQKKQKCLESEVEKMLFTNIPQKDSFKQEQVNPTITETTHDVNIPQVSIKITEESQKQEREENMTPNFVQDTPDNIIPFDVQQNLLLNPSFNIQIPDQNTGML